MKFLRGLGKIFLSIFTYILAIIIILILTLGIIVMTTVIQSAIFVPDEFIIWAAHDSGTRVVFIFEIVFGMMCINFINGKIFKFPSLVSTKPFRFIKKNKARSIAAFSIILIIAIYFMIANISVISSDKIVKHTFFMPQGKEYLYSDIKIINTGVYGNNIPFVRSKGEFYYIVELNDGTKINLSNTGGTKDDKDIYQTIMELDKFFVEAEIPKKVDSRYFDLCEKDLDKIYSNRIKNIFENVK
ncbi:hypothetical protein [Wukongibacter sp. M2B1]|uniref:hypothetical protein n=1 Tax=Wukongibacter sp. M2B1 TaxID=3088895 RepID=UPI003D7BB3AA